MFCFTLTAAWISFLYTVPTKLEKKKLLPFQEMFSTIKYSKCS